jgi:hypothetical protein
MSRIRTRRGEGRGLENGPPRTHIRNDGKNHRFSGRNRNCGLRSGLRAIGLEKPKWPQMSQAPPEGMNQSIVAGMDEHRIAPRRRQFKAGTIEFAGGGIDCTVRNLSETGAALEVVSPLFIPDRFTLLCRATNLSGPAISFGAKKNGSVSHSIEVHPDEER